MPIKYYRCSTVKELEQILELQQRNLFANVSEEERKKEGYVTVVHNFEILKKMNDVCSHIIAKDGEKVVGYALCMHPKFSGEIEVLIPMFREIDAVIPKDKKYLAMGQICVDKAYRKKGIFRKLYETMKAETQAEFVSIITEVDAKNIRSLNAHYAIGFKHLKTYSSGGQDWELIEY